MASYGTPNTASFQNNYYGGAPPGNPQQQQPAAQTQTQNSFGAPMANAGNPYGQQQQMQQQQVQQQQAGVNPFGGYYNEAPTVQPQMAMVPTQPTQQMNQWSIQQPSQSQQAQQQPVQQTQNQKQLPVQTQAQPTTPYTSQTQNSAPLNTASWDPLDPFAGKPAELVPQKLAPEQAIVPTDPQAAVTSQYAVPPSQEQAPPQQQQQQQQPPAVAPPEDDDFFGAFATNSVKNPTAASYEINTPYSADGNDSFSVLSQSIDGDTQKFRYQANLATTPEAGASVGSSRHSQANSRAESARRAPRTSPLDDPRFAPGPRRIAGLENAQNLSRTAPPTASPLPDFGQVKHSGYCLARISFRTILIKKWKQVYWVTYGNNKVLVFRNVVDFEDWVSNPYLSQPQRDFLVKLNIDFVEDLYKQNVRGYQVTTSRFKAYANKMLHQFKLERWMEYGPTIAAAFASSNEKETDNLRIVFTEMLKRSPQAAAMQNRLGNPQTQPLGRLGTPVQSSAFALEPSHTFSSGKRMEGSHEDATYNGDQRFISGNASTGMMSSGSHKSYGVLSTGPVERGQYGPR